MSGSIHFTTTHPDLMTQKNTHTTHYLVSLRCLPELLDGVSLPPDGLLVQPRLGAELLHQAAALRGLGLVLYKLGLK